MSPKSPTKTTTKPNQPSAHIWRASETYALLCLLCRNIHVTGSGTSSGDARNTPSPPSAKSTGAKGSFTVSPPFSKTRRYKAPRHSTAVGRDSAYMDVATRLNEVMHDSDLSADIEHQEVGRMIDRMLGERPAAKAFMERQKVGRITRTMRRVWDRKVGFEGGLQEWHQVGGRRAERMKEMRGEKEKEKGMGAGRMEGGDAGCVGGGRRSRGVLEKIAGVDEAPAAAAAAVEAQAWARASFKDTALAVDDMFVV